MLCLTDALSKLFSGFLKKSEIFTHLKHLFASTLSQVCPCHHSASDLSSLSLCLQPLTCHHSACVFSFRLAIAQPASSASDLPSLSLHIQPLTCHHSVFSMAGAAAFTRKKRMQKSKADGVSNEFGFTAEQTMFALRQNACLSFENSSTFFFRTNKNVLLVFRLAHTAGFWSNSYEKDLGLKFLELTMLALPPAALITNSLCSSA